VGELLASMAASQSELPVWHLAPFDNPRYVDLSYNEEVASAIPECVRSKVFNRFMDVLPNPTTRVKLSPNPRDPTAEYINANYVHGYDGASNAYIAAMG
jgi:protein tyrosine phosphatase